MTATRRLAAILDADAVGYSQLVEWDEAGTMAVLKGAGSRYVPDVGYLCPNNALRPNGTVPPPRLKNKDRRPRETPKEVDRLLTASQETRRRNGGFEGRRIAAAPELELDRARQARLAGARAPQKILVASLAASDAARQTESEALANVVPPFEAPRLDAVFSDYRLLGRPRRDRRDCRSYDVGFRLARTLSPWAHMRLLTMGVILLLVLRFSPRGLK